MTVTESYPAGPITPAGICHLLKGDQPTVTYLSYDNAIRFDLMGPKSLADPRCPERVIIKSLKGLIPPWEKVEQQGANQDGVTFIKAVYGAMQVDAGLEIIGRPGTPLRNLFNKWLASNDVTYPGELACTTPEHGRWWAPVRWAKTPVDQFVGSQRRSQEMNWTWQVDNAFWRTYDNVDTFTLTFDEMTEQFGTNYTIGAGPSWPLLYSANNTGNLFVANGQAQWNIQAGSDARTASVVAGPYAGFSTASDLQVIQVTLGAIPTWTFQYGCYVDAWGRMNRNTNGTWAGDGIRARVGYDSIILSRFNNFTETVMRTIPLTIPPNFGDSLPTLVCGNDENNRLFQVLINDSLALQYVEPDSSSAIGSTHRGVGWGVQAAGGSAAQLAPPNIISVTAGDNSLQTQSGFLKRVNIGDQLGYDRHTCFGPGMFAIADGAGGPPVTFGPLLDGQVVQLRTLPRKTEVVDLTSQQPSQAQISLWETAFQQAMSFATNSNTAPMQQSNASAFGIVPPQGNLGKLLKGRFSAPIPSKLPGSPAPTYQLAVTITGGNATSKVVSALTPQRRYWA